MSIAICDRKKNHKSALLHAHGHQKKEPARSHNEQARKRFESSFYRAIRRRTAAPRPIRPVPSNSKDDGSGVGKVLVVESRDSLHGVVRTLVLPCLSVNTSNPMKIVPLATEEKLKSVGPVKAPRLNTVTLYPPAEGLNDWVEL